MRYILTLIASIMLLAGCAATLSERYSLAKACDQENPDDSAICTPLWDDWNRAEERRMKRLESGCPPRHVKWITPNGVTCVPDADSKDALDRLMRGY